MFVPLHSFLSEEIPDAPQLVPGVLPSGPGIAILAGLPKKKKTFLALDLYARLGDGECFLGRPVTPTPAAYLFLEGSRRALQDRLRVIAGAASAGHHVAVRPERFRLDLPDTRERLADAIRASGTRVVFVDPLAYCHEIDENDNSRMAAFMRAVGDLAQALGVLFVLVHHQAKGARDGDSRGIRGAGALAGATEANLLLTESARGHRLTVELRDGEGVELDLRFDASALRFGVADAARIAGPAGRRDRVLAAFGDEAAPLEIRHLAERTGLSATSVQKAVGDLVSLELVAVLPEKRGKAVLYRLAAAA